MFRTHGRGPGFRSRAERRRRREDRERRARRAYPTITQAIESAMFPSVPEYTIDRTDFVDSRPWIAPAPPWYVRAWNSIAWFFRGLR